MALLKTITVNGVTYAATSPVTTTSVTLLASAWKGSDSVYSQVVEVSGVTPYTKVDLQPSPEQLEVFYEKDLAFTTVNKDGAVTVYAIGDKPQNNYTVQVTATEMEGVTSGAVIKGNTVGTTTPRANWNQTDSTKADYIKGREGIINLIQDVQAASVPIGYGNNGEAISLKGTFDSEAALKEMLTDELNTMAYASKKTIAASFAFGSHGGCYYIIELYKMAFDGYAYADASNYSNFWTRYTLSNHAWLPEEWHNPPMATGIEYRTTERWAGEPVYCYMVNVGALPNTTISEISHGLNATHVIRCEGVTNYGFALPFVVGSNAVHLACDKTKIYVTTTADYSYAQAYVTIYYTKT